MKVLYYDCFSGISGDMNLGAMIDLGVDEKYLKSELDKLNLDGWKIIVKKAQRHGLGGTMVTVKQTRHEHHHRHLSDIDKIVSKSGLEPGVKSLTMNIFRRLAEAEAEVHGTTVEKIHFHEVGAIDSIIDITGAAICFHALGVDEVHVSEIELGGGTVKCEHGRLPVPAPATAAILRKLPVKINGVDFEATTPTGAAILATLGKEFGSAMNFKINKTGHGIGHKEHREVPNILRVFLGETESNPEAGHDAVLLECNIDDMNPELYEHASERLFSEGASDVFLTSILMKKGRPGIKLSVICESGKAGRLREILFLETTTLGIRTFPFRKETLVRELITVDTKFGAVKFKRSSYKGREITFKPEADECRRIAKETGLTARAVNDEIMAVYYSKKEKHNG